MACLLKMKKKNIIFIFLALAVFMIVFVFAGKKEAGQEQVLSSNLAPADKIEVVHFHGTYQCWSCITVGEYALKTIEEKFADEYASGKITFKDVNAELKENQETVAKYQARGSSLFVNAIRNGEDEIEEEITVWRLVSNEEQYISYFENRLRSLLGE